ncbi:hypothetical protein DRQ26_01495 [bacterium]|nr:MAG: hypothetical protein DRQ26_01495 [bacterium]
MARKIKYTDVLEKLDLAQKKLVEKRISAIKSMDIDRDESLREQMLTLDGFRRDIENIFAQLNDFITKHKILSATSARKTATKKRRVKRASKTQKTTSNIRKSNRTKPLPPVGTQLVGKFKGVEYYGAVTKDGIVIEGIDGVFPSMSSAASAVTKRKNLNGWAFWKQIPIY